MLLPPLLPLPPNDCPTAGGVRAVRVWPASNVVLPADYRPGDVSLATALTLRDPANYADVWFLPDSAGFDEPETLDAQGPGYKPQLVLYVSRDAPDLAEGIARLSAWRYLVAAYQDGNGQTKLVGSPDYPLVFSAGLETGKRGADKNGYPLVLAGQSPERAPFYLMLAQAAPPVRRSFSAGFSFGFR